MLVLILILIIYGFYPTIYWLQIPYYLLCSLVLVIGLGWLSSALTVFVKDIRYVIGVITTLLFWLSAIIWPHQGLEGRLRYLVDLNPVFYITNGFRETFIYGKWFYEEINLALFFWFVALFFFIIGAWIFQKLKPHFADVL